MKLFILSYGCLDSPFVDLCHRHAPPVFSYDTPPIENLPSVLCVHQHAACCYSLGRIRRRYSTALGKSLFGPFLLYLSEPSQTFLVTRNQVLFAAFLLAFSRQHRSFV